MDLDSTKDFKTAFGEFLKREHLESVYNQKKLIADWEKIMGKTIARRTEKLFFKDKVLFVKLHSAPLKSEMQYAKARILEMVKQEVGASEINDVRFL